MATELRVAPGNPARLIERSTDDRLDLRGKSEAATVLAGLHVRLFELQARLWAEARRSVLVVLQGMDAGGKDGTIRSVFSGVNPQGVRVVNFKAPAGDEAAHDYLWRIHEHCPRYGEIAIFNRSHYEDIVAVRVHELMPPERWKRRYRHLREFERELNDEGTTIVKVFLHISRQEQRKRLEARLSRPEKNWKFRAADLEDRNQWEEFQRAYEDAISETSTAWAPWYVVPGDRKWVRNVVVSRLLVEVLETMDPRYPPAEPGLDQIEIA